MFVKDCTPNLNRSQPLEWSSKPTCKYKTRASDKHACPQLKSFYIFGHLSKERKRKRALESYSFVLELVCFTKFQIISVTVCHKPTLPTLEWCFKGGFKPCLEVTQWQECFVAITKKRVK